MSVLSVGSFAGSMASPYDQLLVASIELTRYSRGVEPVGVWVPSPKSSWVTPMSSRITSPTPCSGEQTVVPPPQVALVVQEAPMLPPVAQNFGPGPVHAITV